MEDTEGGGLVPQPEAALLDPKRTLSVSLEQSLGLLDIPPTEVTYGAAGAWGSSVTCGTRKRPRRLAGQATQKAGGSSGLPLMWEKGLS